MPSTSKKQHNFMAALANDPKFAKKAGVPQSVGKEFMKADKGRKFTEGDSMEKKLPKKEAPSKMGSVKTAAPSKDGIATKGKTKGKIVKMCGGGKAKK
jgi:hypothetical protein